MTASKSSVDLSSQAECCAIEIEKRLETRLRLLEEEKADLAAKLARRFDEMGTLTKIMARKQEEAADREASAAAQMVALTGEVAQLRAALEQMELSTSWRITRPLRWVMRQFRGA